jgi:hypothetical protein
VELGGGSRLEYQLPHQPRGSGGPVAVRNFFPSLIKNHQKKKKKKVTRGGSQGGYQMLAAKPLPLPLAMLKIVPGQGFLILVIE